MGMAAELAEPAELTFFIAPSTIQAIYLRDFVESQFRNYTLMNVRENSREGLGIWTNMRI